MKRILSKSALLQALMMSLCACDQMTPSQGNSQDSMISSDNTNDDEQVDLSKAIQLDADFNTIIDPPLLKKIDMYNAGCIQPLSNYERDFNRITDLNASALRIDLSIGKNGGTAGQYLVSDDYDIYDYDETNGTYKVDASSLKYDFSTLDSVVKYMSDYDILPYMSWSYIPYPLQEDGKWNNLDTKIENWKEIWEEVFYQYVKYYKEKGVKIGYHEIYNEPDLEILKCWGVFDETFDGFLNWEDFCLGSQCAPGEGVYPDMYEYAVRGILRADPNATIGGPAFALGEIGVESWVGFLPRILQANLPLDFYSFHSYLDGETWFLPEEKRNNGEKNEIEKVVQGLSTDKHFINTAIHINEYSYLNSDNGANNGLNSAYNFFGGASDTIDALMEVVNRTSVQWAYWAQFMESTGGYDPYGLIEHVNGNIKAPYNAIKIYQDMPVWRYQSAWSKENEGLNSLVSADEDKIGILIWNSNTAKNENGDIVSDGDRIVNVRLNHANFAEGTRRVYRIDSENASYFDETKNPELTATNVKTVSLDENIWAGTIPAEGVVYITINKDGNEDFKAYENRSSFANDIKTSYYYEDRFRGLEGSRESYDDYVANIHGSYSHFDRTNWTMYLGMGDCTGKNGNFVGQAHANGSILCDQLPEKFTVSVKTEGNLKMATKNTTLGFRIDFYDENTNSYTKSVYFHNGLYRDTRNPIAQDSVLSGLPVYPWGTQKAADIAVELTGDIWEIDLSKYAPEGWNAANGQAMLSFDMQNTGANTRALFKLSR